MSRCDIKVRFRVIYRSSGQGQQPAVVGSIPELGNWRLDRTNNLHQRARCLPLVSGSPKVWETVMTVPANSHFSWMWVILNTKGTIMKRESIFRRLQVDEWCINLHSVWDDLCEVVKKNVCKVDMRTTFNTRPEELLGICGSTKSLGNWNPKYCVFMDRCYPRESGNWRVSFQINNEMEMEWKLVVLHRATKEVIRWEERGNRTLLVCNQWIKLEVDWSSEEKIIDTMSLDPDEYLNTIKIFEKQRSTGTKDARGASSEKTSKGKKSQIQKNSSEPDGASPSSGITETPVEDDTTLAGTENTANLREHGSAEASFAAADGGSSSPARIKEVEVGPEQKSIGPSTEDASLKSTFRNKLEETLVCQSTESRGLNSKDKEREEPQLLSVIRSSVPRSTRSTSRKKEDSEQKSGGRSTIRGGSKVSDKKKEKKSAKTSDVRSPASGRSKSALVKNMAAQYEVKTAERANKIIADESTERIQVELEQKSTGCANKIIADESTERIQGESEQKSAGCGKESESSVSTAETEDVEMEKTSVLVCSVKDEFTLDRRQEISLWSFETPDVRVRDTPVHKPSEENVAEVLSVTQTTPKVVKTCSKDRISPNVYYSQGAGQRSTSTKGQYPCQVIVNSRSEVVNCDIPNDNKKPTVVETIQAGDCSDPGSLNFPMFCTEMDKGDVLPCTPDHQGDTMLQSSFGVLFEKNTKARGLLGFHMSFTLFSACLIFLKVITDYYFQSI